MLSHSPKPRNPENKSFIKDAELEQQKTISAETSEQALSTTKISIEAIKAAAIIFIVDDYEEVGSMLKEFLAMLGFQSVECFKNSLDVIAMIESGEKAPHLVISDFRMPGIDGKKLHTELCNRLKQSRPEFILLTGFANDIKDTKPGFSVVNKPFDIDQFEQMVIEHLRRHPTFRKKTSI